MAFDMPRVTIHLSESEFEIYKSIPNGQRSAVLKKSLEAYKAKTRTSGSNEELLEELNRMKTERDALDKAYGEIETLMFNLEERIYDMKEKLSNEMKFPIGDQVHPWFTFIDADEFWNQFIDSAQQHLLEDIVFDSPTGRASYRVQGIDNGKVLIERLGTKSTKPSTFTFSTIERALKRLLKVGNDMVKVGGFMPVLAQECAVVEIHPCLRREGDWIIYSKEVK
jgi:hypothetical protein